MALSCLVSNSVQYYSVYMSGVNYSVSKMKARQMDMKRMAATMEF